MSRQRLQAGPGISIAKSKANTIISANVDLSDVESRLDDLEALTDGMSRQSAQVCPAGTVTILST